MHVMTEQVMSYMYLGYMHESCHHDFNFQSRDSYFVEFAPTTIEESTFAYVGSNKISMLMHSHAPIFHIFMIAYI